MSETDTDPQSDDPQAGPDQASAADAAEAQRAADGLRGQIAALRDQVRQARADLLNTPKSPPERRSFKR